MHSINNDLREFRKQLEKGAIQNAYKALLSYMMRLRTHFKNNDYAVSGLYQGYMDMTYFALFPSSLKQRNLKIAIVFNYASFGEGLCMMLSVRIVVKDAKAGFSPGRLPSWRRRQGLICTYCMRARGGAAGAASGSGPRTLLGINEHRAGGWFNGQAQRQRCSAGEASYGFSLPRTRRR